MYLSTDKQAVHQRNRPGRDRYPSRASIPTTLNLAQTYYWKVNEVNDAAAVKVWQGDVWSFSTPEYLVVDDFESYTIDEGNRIYEIWIDGWENKTGSQVGYLDAPFVEQTILHGGRQSMPLTYNNEAAPFYSETERTFDEPQDWTANGVVTLTLYFRGTLGNDGKLYLKIDNTKVAYDGDRGGHRPAGLAAVEHRPAGRGRQPDERQETDDRRRGQQRQGRSVHR